MAELMRLYFAGPPEYTIDFYPDAGYESPEELRESKLVTLDGTQYIYKWYDKSVFEIPVSGLSTADYTEIYTLWQYKETVTFYPDYPNYPAQTYSVKIVNDDNPLRRQYPYWETYEGELILRQV